ncbi:MAG TPA: hypothetical protein VF062_03065 [Candidatus Limnocylindrales bacterium]
MRLKIVESGHRFRQKAMLALFPLLSGARPPDFSRILMYRPELFGKPFGKYAQSVLRSQSKYWSIGERELFGGYISAKNDCDYCRDLHCRMAARALGRSDVDDLISRAFTLRPEVTAVFDFLDRLEQDPSSLTPADLEQMRALGLKDEAILEATHAAAVLSVANRVVNALGARVATPAQRERISSLLLKRGYDL